MLKIPMRMPPDESPRQVRAVIEHLFPEVDPDRPAIDQAAARPILDGMSDEPDSRELAKRFELLKKDFEVMQANVNSTLNEMRAESARRETRMLLAMAAMIGLAVAILGFLI
ncbi:MAG: hypothetical protein F4103_10070 [Boseongicola sp. SB0673_bin_14]|nr:hypothetical protein [Boseongicola sp. SB0667_bin_21]MYI69055.1 hypothetical protein [Boseongicola sp. SB0673_bin_14]